MREKHHGHHHEEDERFEMKHGRRGRGRGGQFFESGELSLLILYLIQDTPRHGYEIMKLIENELSGAFSPSPGVVYPTLTMLEEMGFAQVATEGARKLYSITDGGQAELTESKAAVESLLERMKHASHHMARERPPQLIRAMENLRMVLRMRGGQLTQDQLNSVIDIIDGAAKQIERL